MDQGVLPYVTPSPQGKIRRAARWSDSAFREVYSRYIRPIHAYIFRRVRNHHDAEDITAQVFSQVLNHLDPREVGTPELEAWLFRSARNATANHARARKLVATMSIEELAVGGSSDECDPSHKVLADEGIDGLLEAIRRLPDEQRLALALRFAEELSHAEIADLLGRSESSSRVLIHRTLAGLRKEIS